MKKLTVKFLISVFIFLGRLNNLLYRDPDTLRRARMRTTSAMCRVGCAALGIRVNFTGADNLTGSRGCLVVCNHMSYIDIIALACLRPFVFVSSVDMHETEFVGMMAELGGSYFVERRNASRLREEIEELAELMRRGFAVAIFPEGTSTNGETILPFRAPFIESARKAGAPVYPLCLKYKTIGGEPFSPENRDSVCWYGDMEFAPHLEKFMDVSETVAEVQVLDYVNPADYKRKELSGSLHEKIFTVYSGA